MKQWYLFYTEGDTLFLHQTGAELQMLENQHKTKLHQLGAEFRKEKLHQLGGEFPLPFALVPWRHHVEISATYNNIRIKDVLPTQEQLKERMELLQKELRATKRLMNKN